jgi:hypothetical protein
MLLLEYLCTPAWISTVCVCVGGGGVCACIHVGALGKFCYHSPCVSVCMPHNFEAIRVHLPHTGGWTRQGPKGRHPGTQREHEVGMFDVQGLVNKAGHGKLLVEESLAPRAYGTNVNEQ